MSLNNIILELPDGDIVARLEEHTDGNKRWLETAAYQNEECFERYKVEENPQLAEGWELVLIHGNGNTEESLELAFYDEICDWLKEYKSDIAAAAELYSSLSIREKADEQIKVIQNILKQLDAQMGGNCQQIVVADYTEEEFAELKKGEDWHEWSAIQTIVADRLKELNLADRVILHKVDSVKYYQFLAEQKLEHNTQSLSYFAAIDYGKGNGDLRD
jgi:hypothetical protein